MCVKCKGYGQFADQNGVDAGICIDCLGTGFIYKKESENNE